MARDFGTRTLALSVLGAVHDDGAYANLVLPRALRESSLDSRDRGFATELVYGTLRREGELDVVIAEAARRPVAEIDNPTLDILRLGVYQALFMRVLAYAVVDQSVRLAKSAGAARSAGFVNAVLRKVTGLPPEHWGDVIEGNVSSVHAHPPWIAKEIEGALAECEGSGELGDALDAHNVAPGVTLAVLPGLAERTQHDHPTEFSDIGVLAPGGDPGLDARVANGVVRVQDEGSQLAALLLGRYTPLEPGERILDMCAGPGGKTAVLGALALQAGARVLAQEKVPHRAELVKDSIRAISALDPDVVTVEVRDSTKPIPGTQTFDRILLDAPCTGLGALRRRPEARWRKSKDDIPGLQVLQRALLERAVQSLTPGGLIAYVTCSPVSAETTEIVQQALDAHPGLVAVDTPAALAQVLGVEIPGCRRGTAVQLWTHRHATDSMFMQLLTTAKSG